MNKRKDNCKRYPNTNTNIHKIDNIFANTAVKKTKIIHLVQQCGQHTFKPN